MKTEFVKDKKKHHRSNFEGLSLSRESFLSPEKFISVLTGVKI